MACDLDLGSGHTAYRHASLIDLYLHTKFHWNRRNVLWTDGQTYGRTSEIDCIRSTRRRRPKKMQTQAYFVKHIQSHNGWSDWNHILNIYSLDFGCHFKYITKDLSDIFQMTSKLAKSLWGRSEVWHLPLTFNNAHCATADNMSIEHTDKTSTVSTRLQLFYGH